MTVDTTWGLETKTDGSISGVWSTFAFLELSRERRGNEKTLNRLMETRGEKAELKKRTLKRQTETREEGRIEEEDIEEEG